MNFLLIIPGNLGDQLLCTPLIRALHQNGHGVAIAGFERHSQVLAKHPFVSGRFVIGNDELPPVDRVIDLVNSSQTRFVSSAISVPVTRIEDVQFDTIAGGKGFKMFGKKKHWVHRSFETVADLNIKPDDKGLEFFTLEMGLQDIPASHHAGYVAIAIGASKRNKRLPVKMLAELCGKIDFPIVLLGDGSEREEGEMISHQDRAKIYNACGKFTLPETAALIRDSRLLVAHDSGMMHLGTTMQKDTILIWGSTIEERGKGPYLGKHTRSVMEHWERKIWCRPCTSDGGRNCPLSHFNCMRKHSMTDLAQSILEKVRSPKTPVPL